MSSVLPDGRNKKVKPRFLADESCDFAVVRALRAARYDVLTVKEVMAGAPDEEVIAFALRESRILLTEDKDFGQLVFASGEESPGVIFFRFPANARQAMRQSALELIQTRSGKIPKHFLSSSQVAFELMKNTRKPKQPPTADQIALMADKKKNISKHFTNAGKMMPATRTPQVNLLYRRSDQIT